MQMRYPGIRRDINLYLLGNVQRAISGEALWSGAVRPAGAANIVLAILTAIYDF